MDNTIIGDTNASNRADSRLRFQAPPWEHVAGVLTQMQGTRVKRISMYMQKLSLDSLTGVVPFMKTVEHLVIYLAESWSALDALAPLVFVHLPNLKSFLLSDAPRFKYVDDNWGRFEYAVDSSVQKQILEGWDRNMAGEMRGNAWKLERVGFTALFAWNRQPDRSWLAEEATKDKTMWRNYEDDEDDSSESGSGSGSEEDSESEQSM
ncbi:hypothetical protein EUX98_g1351 [Antrodiella citrinella]|uniref:Uncharacterized protein n=1 Tax=Antrodiella citrinella TaxID=2447956 RepID=A0A4S4N1R7_9APHY|nr:hypothetical protein EUX98_g1351 [Antrodiella citrinella]